MAQSIPDTSVVVQAEEPASEPRRPISGVTWRFLGDRVAADSAYCIRFNVQQAPEPLVALDGAWAYTLPGAKPALT